MNQKTKQYNVTHLTKNQRRELFKTCINQTGFIAFIKNQNKNSQQTNYIFRYQN